MAPTPGQPQQKERLRKRPAHIEHWLLLIVILPKKQERLAQTRVLPLVLLLPILLIHENHATATTRARQQHTTMRITRQENNISTLANRRSATVSKRQLQTTGKSSKATNGQQQTN